DAPGHLFTVHNAESEAALARMVHLMMKFNWEGYLSRGTADPFVWLDNEIVEITTASEPAEAALHALLERCGIENMTQWFLDRAAREEPPPG
ncbi:MAG TPA: hypothetical protein VK689_18325, partial [Armatimonadota bacterium]|nr:hypothetical protein [Armatimonadota bacterium]